MSGDDGRIWRLGVLGLGEGRSVLSAAGQSPNWTVSCICDLREALCRERAREFDLSVWTQSYAEMLAREDVDVVAVFTPDPLHAGHMLQALRAGKHVICTKPAVDNLSRARELLEEQTRSGRQVLIGHSYRFFQTFLRQREEFEAGVHDGLVSCEAWYNPDKRKGSAGARGKKGEVDWLYSGLGHAVDLVVWYLGEIGEVHANAFLSPAARELGSQVPDCFHALLKSKSGPLGLVSGIYGAPRAHPQASSVAGCTLRGNRATTTATNPVFDYYAVEDGKTPRRETHIDDGGYYFRWGGSGYHAGEIQNYLEHFADCLNQGRKPAPDLRDGLYVVAVLGAIEESIKLGKPAKVPKLP